MERKATYGGIELLKIVLKKNIVREKPIFEIAGFTHSILAEYEKAWKDS